jgi:hypothetical protein
LPGEGLLGVSGVDKSINDLGGVRIRPFNSWPYLYPPKTAKVHCPDEVAHKAVDWGRHQIGAPFDNAALYAFLRDRAGLLKIGRVWRDPDKWFCSEFALRAIEQAGLFPYPLITPKDTVSPNTLLIHLNPFLSLENIMEF